MQNNVPQFEPVLDCLFSTLGSDFLENCGLVIPNLLRFSSLCLHTSRAYFLNVNGWLKFGKKQGKCHLGQGSSGGGLSRVPDHITGPLSSAHVKFDV